MTLSTLNKPVRTSSNLTDFNGVKKRLESTLQTLFQLISDQSWFGTQYSTAYDTAWGASVETYQKNPYFPQAVQWLFDNQHYDGSWGSGVKESTAERMLSTVTALGTLLQYFPSNDTIDRGFNWIHNNFKELNNSGIEYTRPVGFELLFPSVLRRLSENDSEERLNINIEPILQLQQKKLSRLPLEQILRTRTPVIFSLEFLTEQEELLNKIPLDHQLSSNYSMACSPATSAWYASLNPKTKSGLLHYLRESQHFDGGWPVFADFELMNIAFSLYPISRSLGSIPASLNSAVKRLYNNWTPQGISFSQHFDIPDADDTVVGLYCLVDQGLVGNEGRFWQSVGMYETEDSFKTYDFELEPSLMVNVHALELFLKAKEYPQRRFMIDKLTSFLESKISKNGFGPDKFHFSPGYINYNALLAFSECAPDLAEKTFQYFDQSKRPNGLWGSFGTNVEETAYAVAALSHYHQHIEPINLNMLSAGVDYLMSNWNSHYDEQWICKVHFSPKEMTEAQIFSALASYAKARGMNISF